MVLAGTGANALPIEMTLASRPRSEPFHMAAELQFPAEARLLEMVASGCPLPTVLEALCRSVEPEIALECHCSVTLIDRHGLSFEDFGPPGLHVSWSTAILSRTGEVLGTLAVLQEKAGPPSSQQQYLIAKAAHIASVAIERAQRDEQLVHTEEALREARSELAYVAHVMSLGALSASIAHEIKQPLSGIITNASTCLRMLAADPPDLEGARDTAKRTLRDGNRASDVITRLRALFTKKTVAGEAVDLNQIAIEALALANNDLRRRRVVVQTELAAEIATIRGDRIQLHQVILNLILNAADAMSGIDDRPRRLRIKTQLDGADRVLLSVRDTGTGLGPHEARLFEPFYTTKSDGMGIGLAISQAIVANHGGRLWAAPNEGPGATFCFSIPCTYDR